MGLQGLYLETTPLPCKRPETRMIPFLGLRIEKKNRRVDQSYTFVMTKLGGGFNYFLCSPLFGEDSHFD